MSSNENTMNAIQSLSGLLNTLKKIDDSHVDLISDVRELKQKIKNKINDALNDVVIPEKDLNDCRIATEALVQGQDIDIDSNITVTPEVSVVQLGTSNDVANFRFAEGSKLPPEKGTIVQKIWRVNLINNNNNPHFYNGYVIFSDANDRDFCELVGAQVSTALADSPNGAVEDLGI